MLLRTTANADEATPLPTLLTQQCWELLLRPFARSFTDQLRQNFPQRQRVYLDERFSLLFCFVFLFCLSVFYVIFVLFCFFFFSSFQQFAVLYKFYFCHLKLNGKTKRKNGRIDEVDCGDDYGYGYVVKCRHRGNGLLRFLTLITLFP